MTKKPLNQRHLFLIFKDNKVIYLFKNKIKDLKISWSKWFFLIFHEQLSNHIVKKKTQNYCLAPSFQVMTNVIIPLDPYYFAHQKVKSVFQWGFAHYAWYCVFCSLVLVKLTPMFKP
jgi:hypothetical protein